MKSSQANRQSAMLNSAWRDQPKLGTAKLRYYFWLLSAIWPNQSPLPEQGRQVCRDIPHSPRRSLAETFVKANTVAFNVCTITFPNRQKHEGLKRRAKTQTYCWWTNEKRKHAIQQHDKYRKLHRRSLTVCPNRDSSLQYGNGEILECSPHQTLYPRSHFHGVTGVLLKWRHSFGWCWNGTCADCMKGICKSLYLRKITTKRVTSYSVIW